MNSNIGDSGTVARSILEVWLRAGRSASIAQYACPGGAIGMRELDCGVRGTTQSVPHISRAAAYQPDGALWYRSFRVCFETWESCAREWLPIEKSRDVCVCVCVCVWKRERDTVLIEGRAHRMHNTSLLLLITDSRMNSRFCFHAALSSKLIGESVSDRNYATVTRPISRDLWNFALVIRWKKIVSFYEEKWSL